jgi:hypothetical protein
MRGSSGGLEERQEWMPLLELEPIAGVDYTGQLWDARPAPRRAPADADGAGRLGVRPEQEHGGDPRAKGIAVGNCTVAAKTTPRAAWVGHEDTSLLSAFGSFATTATMPGVADSTDMALIRPRSNIANWRAEKNGESRNVS